MSTLSLEVTLTTSGEKKIFPLTNIASDYSLAGSWHEYLMPHISTIENIHLDQFTNDEFNAWECVSYHYGEGRATSGEVTQDEGEEGACLNYSWQILLDGEPANYAQVDHSLNADFYLHYTSTAFDGPGCVPLDKGRWTLVDGRYTLDKSFGELVLADAMYDLVDISEDHYGKVLDALAPIFSRESDFMKLTIDDIDYVFELKRTDRVTA